ncbi:putative benzoate carboxyl methyltransferase-like [Capsicum annuum]|nr:putative benzoate carboxyl methyltransferase-like [Capsicum annuum]
MRILSKTWKQAWLTLSNLEFRVEYMSRGSVIVDTIMERYRDDKIPIDKFEFSNYSGSNDNDLFFIRINTWLDMALQNGVKDIIYENPYYLTRSYPFPIINVLAGKCFKRIGFERSQSLKVLMIQKCPGIRNIDSSNLVSLEYIGDQIPKLKWQTEEYPTFVDALLWSCCYGSDRISKTQVKEKQEQHTDLRGNSCGKNHGQRQRNFTMKGEEYNVENDVYWKTASLPSQGRSKAAYTPPSPDHNCEITLGSIEMSRKVLVVWDQCGVSVARYTKTTKRLAERSVMGPTYCRGKSKGAGVYKMGLSATVYHVWAGKEPKGVSEVHKTNNSHCKGFQFFAGFRGLQGGIRRQPLVGLVIFCFGLCLNPSLRMNLSAKSRVLMVVKLWMMEHLHAPFLVRADVVDRCLDDRVYAMEERMHFDKFSLPLGVNAQLNPKAILFGCLMQPLLVLIGLKCTRPYSSSRVMRQLGRKQDIPPMMDLQKNVEFFKDIAKGEISKPLPMQLRGRVQNECIVNDRQDEDAEAKVEALRVQLSSLLTTVERQQLIDPHRAWASGMPPPPLPEDLGNTSNCPPLFQAQFSAPIESLEYASGFTPRQYYLGTSSVPLAVPQLRPVVQPAPPPAPVFVAPPPPKSSHLCWIGKPFIEVLKMGEMIEEGIKIGQIVSFAALKATTQAIQSGFGTFEGEKKKEDMATVVAGSHASEVPNINQNPLPAHTETNMLELVYGDKESSMGYKSIVRIQTNEDKLVNVAYSLKAMSLGQEEKGKEIVEKIDELGGLTRSGRCFVPEGLRTPKPVINGPSSLKKPVIEEEAEKFLRKIKLSEYSIIDQLKRTPAQISFLSLLLHSKKYRDVILKVLNEDYVLGRSRKSLVKSRAMKPIELEAELVDDFQNLLGEFDMVEAGGGTGQEDVQFIGHDVQLNN